MKTWEKHWQKCLNLCVSMACEVQALLWSVSCGHWNHNRALTEQQPECDVVGSWEDSSWLEVILDKQYNSDLWTFSRDHCEAVIKQAFCQLLNQSTCCMFNHRKQDIMVALLVTPHLVSVNWQQLSLSLWFHKPSLWSWSFFSCLNKTQINSGFSSALFLSDKIQNQLVCDRDIFSAFFQNSLAKAQRWYSSHLTSDLAAVFAVYKWLLVCVNVGGCFCVYVCRSGHRPWSCGRRQPKS